MCGKQIPRRAVRDHGWEILNIGQKGKGQRWYRNCGCTDSATFHQKATELFDKGFDHIPLVLDLDQTAGLPDGVPCSHPGCLSHRTHPCEGCGRVSGRRVPPNPIALLLEAMGDRRAEIRRTITRDVIFLLQARRIQLTIEAADDIEISDGEDGFWKMDPDSEGMVLRNMDSGQEMTGKEAEDFLLEHGRAVEIWDDVEIYGTHDEAQDVGEATDHRYPSGWRVYGMPLGGKLAEALRPDMLALLKQRGER